MRIAMIGCKGIPATWGGVERHVEEISARLAARGHEVTVYCRPYYSNCESDYYRGIRLQRVPTIPSKSLDAITHTFLSTMHAISEGYDILHYHALGPATMSAIARLAGKRTIATVHGLDWQREKWGRAAKFYLKLGERMSVEVPDCTIAVSRFLRDYLEDKYGKRIAYIPNAVLDPVRIPPDRIRAYGLGEKDYILFVARLVPEKGCHFLIEAFKRLDPNMKLVIAGGSSHSEDYVAGLQADASEKIIFTGYAHGEILNELYTNAYCYVHPSTIEGLPFTLLEAASYGNCLIASDIPPNVEVVGDAGILFESQNVVSITECLSRVIENPVLARSLAQRAGEAVRSEYNYDSVTARTEEVYRIALK